MPAPDGGDDLIWVGGPDEGFGLGVVSLEIAVDRDLKIDDRPEHTALQSPFGEGLAKKPSTTSSHEQDVGVK